MKGKENNVDHDKRCDRCHDEYRCREAFRIAEYSYPRYTAGIKISFNDTPCQSVNILNIHLPPNLPWCNKKGEWKGKGFKKYIEEREYLEDNVRILTNELSLAINRCLANLCDRYRKE